ncbi:MAG: hypothetical protein WAS73_09530 [Defluviicoccus sp.]
MPEFSKKRFDDRDFRTDDDGDAFALFIHEFLRLRDPEIALVRGLAIGRDGAIDLIDTGKEVTCIVECKFIGAGTKSNAQGRWVEVEQHLEKNLPKAAAGSGAEKYRPWLKSQGGLKVYRFATSAICASADERFQLRTRIQKFFSNIAMSHQELNHLASIDVELIYWDDIIGYSAQLVPLFYRWLGGYPQGYGDIAACFGQSEAGFKRFLESRKLPYFSREEYDAQLNRQASSVFSSSLLHLTNGNEGRALVISGSGGTGKTRLAIEICEKARAEGWWPLRLERFAKAENLDEICANYATSSRVLLFIDYAEAFIELDRLHEAVFRLSRDGQHHISIIASTRASSLQQVTDRLNDITPQVLRLDRGGEHEGYDAWVVRQILDHFQVPNAESISASCSGLPVLAAFAAFLYERDRTKFEEQFGNLAAVRDFEGWAKGRLNIIERRFTGQPVQRAIAELAARLPISEDQAEALRAESALNDELFEVLIADHWIEWDDLGLSAAHDVLADVMLARHLAGMPNSEQSRLNALLVKALDERWLDRCLTSVDRLGQHPVFQKLSGLRAAKGLLRHDRVKALEQFPVLVQSRLVSHADLIELLAESDDLRHRLSRSFEACLVVARTAEWAASKGRANVDRSRAETALTAPLTAAVDFPHKSNIFLRCAHAFDPERYHNAVVAWLNNEPSALASHYLIVSLLRSGTPPEKVQRHLRAWLDSNATAFKASFVYRSWLDAQGAVEDVRSHVLAWLGQHDTAPEAQFVYKSWLDAQGAVEDVRSHVLAWLGQHATEPDADYVYRSWLETGQPFGEIREHCEYWLKEHWHRAEAVYVTKALSKEKNLSRGSMAIIVAWAGTHAEHEDAVYRLSRMSRWIREHELPFAFLKLLDRSTEAVVAKLLIKSDIDAGQRHACTSLFGNLGRIPVARNYFWLNTLEHFSKCLRHGGLFSYVQDMPAYAWTLLLHDAIAERIIDPSVDQSAINHALELVRRSMEPHNFEGLLASGYLRPVAKGQLMKGA